VIAEGAKLAREALRSGRSVEQVIYTRRLLATDDGSRLLQELLDAGAPCRETSENVLASLQDARSPQPILCVVRSVPSSDEGDARRIAAVAERGGLILLLGNIQDPGNLGSIVRSADSAGVELVGVAGDGVDPSHPRALRASAGALFRLVPVVAPLSSTIEFLRTRGYTVLGADPRGSVAYDRVDLRRRIALVLGSESGGLPRSIEESVDLRVRIPMRPEVESLSVAAAAAVLLFEVRRQRSAD